MTRSVVIRLRHTVIACIAAIICLVSLTTTARELRVGATRILKLPSDVAAVAMNGDVVRIDPGTSGPHPFRQPPDPAQAE